MSENPFKSRWAVDDSEFIKLRKKQWPFLKNYYESRGNNAREIKELKIFFLNGDWLNGHFPEIKEIISWTPCKNEIEVQELLAFLFEHGKPSNSSHRYIRSLHYHVAIGDVTLSPDAPTSFSCGNEALLAKVIVGDSYSDTIDLSLINHESIPRYVSPQEFISEYEQYLLYYLIKDRPNYYSPVKYSLEFYISCVKYLEGRGDRVEHHENFAHIISTAFNFVEGGQTGDKPPSSVAEFAQLFKERVTQADAPETIKTVIKSLEPDYLIEVERQPLIDTKVYVFNRKIKQSLAYGVPLPKAMRGCEHSKAIQAFWKAAKNSDLIDADSDFPELFQVNVELLLSEEVINELGYKAGEPVPAYRFTTWYQPNMNVDCHGKGKFGADLILIIPKNGVISDDLTTVIYYPRLNSYYKDFFPSSVLYLKERQVRRSIWEFTHKHLLKYDDDWCSKLVNSFMDSAYIELGFKIFKNSSEGNNEHSISGPDTPPWDGEPLPELNLKEILNHVR